MLYGFGEFLYRRKIFMMLYKCIKMYRTVSQFFGFYPKFIQGKKSHKNQTEKFKTKLRKIRQNPRKTLDIFALCSNKIQSQNYTFVIPLFLLIQKLYEKSAVSYAHDKLKNTLYSITYLCQSVCHWFESNCPSQNLYRPVKGRFFFGFPSFFRVR